MNRHPWWNPVGWWGRLRGTGPLTKAVLAAVGVLAVAAGGWLVYVNVLRTDPSCGPGVEKRGPEDAAECTGVTDGTVAFAPSLEQVSDRIKEENDRVVQTAGEKGGKYATIAMMVPMTSKDPVVTEQILHEVQGVYLAQYAANHEANEERPLIRLVLANPGSDSRHWQPVADQVADMAGDTRHNLRAVVGFDLSVENTQRTIDHLTRERGIPVVGGPLTADDLRNTGENPKRYPGLAHIAPTNGDQAKALTHFNKQVEAEETLVVQDRRENDNYIDTLKEAFRPQAEASPVQPEEYQSPPDINDEGTLSNDFQDMVSNICDGGTRVVYFAGRPVQLRQFVNALGARHCTDKKYTVVTGSGASTLATDEELDWDALKKDGGVTVEYAAVGHPDAWKGDDAPATGGSAQDVERLRDLADRARTDKELGPIGSVSLNDSRTMSTYDSALTAIAGIRNQTSSDNPVPSTDDVANAWLQMKGSGNKVRGSTGWICLDTRGNPHNKAVAVVRLDPVGRKIDFLGTAWPTGGPPDENCTIERS